MGFLGVKDEMDAIQLTSCCLKQYERNSYIVAELNTCTIYFLYLYLLQLSRGLS